jgi:hypothetical protein
MACPQTEMRTLWRSVVRTIFWSYERGSWPYDLMVLAILAFVLLTPRGWFHDQPQNAALAAADIQLLTQDDADRTRIYRLNAGLLPVPKRASRYTPELEREIHEILGKSVDDLKGLTFQITNIRPVGGDDGAVLYYDVELKSSTGRAR